MKLFPNTEKWKQKFIKDLKNKEFLPIKGLFFLIFGANVSLIPFLTLQARSLGITEEEVGIIYSFIPIASLIAPPLSGMLADRIGNFRILLSGLTALAGLSGVLFLIVPVGRITHKLPDTLPLEITCSSHSGDSLRVAQPYDCTPTDKFDRFSVDVMNCSVTCFDTNESTEDNLIKSVGSNLFCKNSSTCMSVSPEEYALLTNETSNSTTDFPFTTENVNVDFTTPMKGVIVYSSLRSSSNKVVYTTTEPMCPQMTEISESNQTCYTVCQAETFGKHMCSNKKSVQESNPSLTFYSHLAIRVVKEFTIATSMPLLEGAAVTILKEHNGDFGFQRLYCNLGMMLMTPISGSLIDYYTKVNGHEDFRPAMIMYCGLKLIAAFVILFLNLEFKKASTKVVADFSYLILNPEIMCFLLATFLAGTCYGYIETFLFWLLEDLGADKQLMGITLTVGSVFGIPLLMISTAIMKRIGHINTIVLGFAVYIIRLFGYTIISSPWWAMPFEALECFTVSLMVVAFVSYAAVLATPSTVVTLQGLYGGLYNGVGRGAGSLIGGFLIENIGIFNAFRVIAAIGGTSGIGYWTINFCFFRKRNRSVVVDIEKEVIGKDETDKKEVKTEKSSEERAKENENKEKVVLEMVASNGEATDVRGYDNKAFDGENLQRS